MASIPSQTISSRERIHWVRILVGGFMAEALLIVLVIPIAMKWGQHPLLYVAPVGSLLTCFVVHGLLVGVVAAVIYVALTLARPEPMAYVIAHGLKLLGGTAGGWFAGRQRENQRGA